MSGTIAVAATAAIATFATVLATALPETRAILSPILEGGNEYTVAAGSLLLSLPAIALLTILAVLSRE